MTTAAHTGGGAQQLHELLNALRHWREKKLALDEARPDFTREQLRELNAAESRLLALDVEALGAAAIPVPPAPDLVLDVLRRWQQLVNFWYAEDALEHLGGNIIKALGHDTDAAIKALAAPHAAAASEE